MVHVGEDPVPPRLELICSQGRMERILSAGKCGSEVVSDLYANANKMVMEGSAGQPHSLFMCDHATLFLPCLKKAFELLNWVLGY